MGVTIWLQAKLNGVRLSLVQIREMGPHAQIVLRAAILARKGRVNVTPQRLHEHAKAGGHPGKVVLGLVAAKEGKLDATFDDLAQVDLRGEDVLAEVRKRQTS